MMPRPLPSVGPSASAAAPATMTDCDPSSPSLVYRALRLLRLALAALASAVAIYRALA